MQDISKEINKIFVTQKNRYQENKEKLYSVILGKSLDVIQSKLQSV